MKKYLPWVGLLARLVLGGVLLAAGLLKYQHLDKSQMAVRAYEMLPIALANFLGIILPFVEIAVGINPSKPGMGVSCPSPITSSDPTL